MAQGLIFGLICATFDGNLAVAIAACNALVKAVEFQTGLDAVFAPECCEEMRARIFQDSAATNASVVCMRLLELVCRMWSISADSAARCKALGVKEHLLTILDGDDILMQLNALELLAYLPPKEIGEDLLSQLLTTAEESLGSGAVPVRVLSCVATFVAQQEGMVPAPLQARLCAILSQRIPRERPGCDGTAEMLSILAALCETPRGLGALDASAQLAGALAHIAPNLQSQHQPSKLAVLSLIVNIVRSSALACRANAGGSAPASAASAALHQTLAPLIPRLMQLTRTPILEERIGALCACRSLAMHRWGIQLLFAQTDFLTFIIDRKEESSKRGLEEKVRDALTARCSYNAALSLPPCAYVCSAALSPNVFLLCFLILLYMCPHITIY